MEVALQEELKGIYSRPKPIRGEQSPRNICLRWLETSQSPQYTVLRVSYDRGRVKYWIRDEDGR